ncbi:MAG: T9SS type A sorting domain-containing protein [Sphingobacteriales bacterium]|nr:MAG: T9SS type A sorting domain-containing protein [Sphingobacteriales bacterium]
MNLWKALFLLVLSLPFLPASAQRVSALLLGNSYTAYNNLPQLTAAVALSAGDTLLVQSNAPGGVTLQTHSRDATSLQLLRQGTYDYTVLQEQSQAPAFPDAQVAVDVYPYARTLDSLSRAANPCTQTIFYRTWGRQNGDAGNCAFFPPICTYSGMDSLLARRYRIMADSNRAVLSPVGQVWKSLRQSHPTLVLYQADESHPTLAGSYIAACTFYTVFFRKSPLRITSDESLPAADALAIRQAVKAVVYDSLLYWNVGRYDPKAAFTFTGGPGRQIGFQNQSMQATQYQWQFGTGQGSDTSTHPTYTFPANGTYSVRLIALRCGWSDTLTRQVTVSAAGVTSSSIHSEIRISPNPAGDLLHVAGLSAQATVQVLDLQGRLLSLDQHWEGTHLILATESLATGTYLLRIQASGKPELHRFRKQ